MGRPFSFDWDDRNAEHISRHDYVPDEVEEVFAGAFDLRKTRDGRYVAAGPTLDGRMTIVVFERYHGSRIRVITAREMTSKERRRYRRR
jgi:uncharacterized protein